MNRPFDDEDEEKDALLQALSGEVDDYAGSKLEDPNKKGPAGVTITIAMAPHQPDKDMEEEEPGKEGEDGEHDEIAHILGMCGGGCAR